MRWLRRNEVFATILVVEKVLHTEKVKNDPRQKGTPGG
jgi:hypothetical protein